MGSRDRSRSRVSVVLPLTRTKRRGSKVADPGACVWFMKNMNDGQDYEKKYNLISVDYTLRTRSGAVEKALEDADDYGCLEELSESDLRQFRNGETNKIRYESNTNGHRVCYVSVRVSQSP